ncbi:SLC13 family permease [Sulfurimonas sp. HSL-3221]|uniref:SLC13 family permease n=1 Tax=Thiomicrolovo sulfuroxydans TaxID=2894755 RepID=UPI001E44DC98|nr:SLC13 family permease [Sulfurimonas sp. HSL-3221]UFS62274.1 SLC13 family permease [Sulfurimonas sp. HSL-3221]
MSVMLVLFSLGGLIVLLIRGTIRPGVLFFGLLMLYYLTGLIETKAMLHNFVNPSLIVLVLLIVISSVIERTAVVEWLSHAVFSRNRFASMLRLTGLTSLFSAFLNNTAVVASMMSMVKNNKHVAPSKAMIPLSYAAIFGGTMTLIGTSTNLIVNGFVVDAGLTPLSLFDFIYVGLPLAVAGGLFLSLFGSKLLPTYATKGRTQEERYFLEARVGSDSPLAGKTIQENGLRSMEQLFLAEVMRGERLISPVTPREVLQAGDVLIFTGNMRDVQELNRFKGLAIFDNKRCPLQDNLTEVVVSHESALVGHTIKTAEFRTKFDAAVVAVRRGSEKLSGKLGNIELQAGDTLLLTAGEDFSKRENLKKNFYFVSNLSLNQKFDTKTSLLILGLFLGAIVLSATGVLPFLKGLFVLLGLFIILKFLSLRDVKLTFPFELVLIIGSALGIAQVLMNSGVADMLGNGIKEATGSMGIYGTFAAVYLMTFLLTEIITNNAAAALSFPVAYATATALGADPMPFIMAVAYGASASFMSPYGYQTNLMVYGPGGYKFADFVRIGLPVSVLYSALVLALVPIFFPFEG